MGPALRQCLLHGDAELRVNGLELIRETREYGQMSTLMDVLTSDHAEVHDDAARTVHALVDALYDQIQSAGSSDRSSAGNMLQVRRKVLTSLDGACARFDSLAHAREVVRGVLALGDPEHFAVKRVLGQAGPACRKLSEDMLLQSRHPGVMQLACDSLSQNYPHPKAIEAIQSRCDPEFIEHLLRSLPKRPTKMQQKNLKQIEDIAWLSPESPAVERIPDELHAPLVSLTSLSGLPRERKSQVREWMVRHGSPEGRVAAGDSLFASDDESAQRIVLSSLDAEDPGQEAWAVAQLRSRGVPQTFQLLIERLDSPSDEVQEAARTELSGFGLDTMLGLFEHLDPEMCLRCGTLLQKIDPEIVNRLLRELASPIRQKRIRVARAVGAMGLQRLVLPGLLAILEDSDAHVRRTGVELLENVRDPLVVRAMTLLADDPSPRVRDAAARVLRNMQNETSGTSAETSAKGEH